MDSHDCKEELRGAGSKVTAGRLRLLAVLEREHKPLTVRQIEKRLPSLNPVTLYRALEALVGACLVYKGESNRVTHFEYARKSHHHHMVCADCGLAQVCRTC